jgi:hypothetical protein
MLRLRQIGAFDPQACLPIERLRPRPPHQGDDVVPGTGQRNREMPSDKATRSGDQYAHVTGSWLQPDRT